MKVRLEMAGESLDTTCAGIARTTYGMVLVGLSRRGQDWISGWQDMPGLWANGERVDYTARAVEDATA